MNEMAPPTAVPPSAGPDRATLDAWRAYALAYLKTQLGPHAPPTLGDAVLFADSPLEGDGAGVVFAFEAAPGGRERQTFHVVVGRTSPNYYPAWGLAPEEAWLVHLGTRFMLTLQIAQLKDDTAGAYDPTDDVRRMVDQVAPGEPLSDVSVAALFQAGTECHAVCRCRVGGEPVYVLTRDCPPGFSRQVDLPPHVVYRMHLGRLLQQEADDEAREESVRRAQQARAAQHRPPLAP